MKLPRLQYHLATLLILQFSIGLILYANLTKRKEFDSTKHSMMAAIGDQEFAAYGWPVTAVRYFRSYTNYDGPGLGEYIPKPPDEISIQAIILNLVCAVLILTTVGLVCERQVLRVGLQIKKWLSS